MPSPAGVSAAVLVETWDRTHPSLDCRSRARDWLNPKAEWRNSVLVVRLLLVREFLGFCRFRAAGRQNRISSSPLLWKFLILKQQRCPHPPQMPLHIIGQQA